MCCNSGSISEAVPDNDAVTADHYVRFVDDVEWPSMSFTYCQPFRMLFLVQCVAIDKILKDLERHALALR